MRTLWRLMAPSGRTITCAFYQTADGFELRAGEGEGDRLLWQRVYTDRAADALAQAWRTAAERKGFRALTKTSTISCPHCLAWRGQVKYATGLPHQLGALSLKLVCAVCEHSWTVIREPACG